MIQASSIRFLKELRSHNDRNWFEQHRKDYEAAKADMEALNREVVQALSKHDPSIAHLTPKDCLFRINRDVRFSKDKSPYKTNMGMAISKGGKKDMGAGYYFHFEPGNSMIGGGLWMPMAPALKQVRQEIDYCWDEFHAIIGNKRFKAAFGDLERDGDMSLSRPPKGYSDDNPAIAYLKLKSFVAMHKITDADLQHKDLVKRITETFVTLKPLLDFLNRAMEQ